jgi:hypothetical protein
MYTTDDIDALVQFWKENSGWDQIDRTEWERRFYYTPFGSASIVLAMNDQSNEIIGQFLFIPTRIYIDGREVKGFRPFAPVVKESVRSELGFMTLIEVVMKMYNHAMDEFRKEGVGLIHMLPDPRWSKAFQFLPGIQLDHFPLWSRPLPLNQIYDLPEGYSIRPIASTDERINALWEKSRELYGCSFLRNTTTLPWKASHGNYQLIGVFKHNDLVGFSSSIVKAHDKQWLICDLLAANADEAMEVTLKASCNLAQEFLQSHEEVTVNKIAILATSLMQEKLEYLGFKKDEYRFPMVIQVLDDTITQEQAAPKRWYASAND